MIPGLHEAQQNTSQLPEGWSEPAIAEDVLLADGVELNRAGLSSTGPDGEEVTGAAAEAGASPVARSYFELLERVSTKEAIRNRRSSYHLTTTDGQPAGHRAASDVFAESDEPTRWRYARSNGIALHADWKSASERAFWELCERDRILRTWYGETSPRRLVFDVGATPLGGAQSYEWVAYSFPRSEAAAFSRDVEVAGVFGFPLRTGAPLVLGYGSRPSQREALGAAVREATQLLAFLWGEALPERLPDAGPTPAHHLERFQFEEQHGVLREWLGGAHTQYAMNRPAQESTVSTVAFLDITPAWLQGGLRVAKAVCRDAAPLAFGDSPFVSHLPPHLRLHPIA